MSLTPVQASQLPQTSDVNQPLRILLHVATSNRASHKAAIANAIGLQNHYGKDNVIVEIVANGVGISIANSRNVFKKKISTLLNNGVTLSVCNMSLNKLRQKNGKKIPLVDGVHHVPNGIIRVIELQKQGYLYVRP